MKVLSPLLLAPTVAAVLLLACTPTNAAHRGGGSAYDGIWSVAIYALRGDCGSVRVAARIVGGRVYSKDQSYQANGAVGANGVIRVSVASGRLLAVMRDPSIPAEWRFRAAQAAAPYVHVKPERPPATEPAATARQIESESDTDPLAEAIKAFRRGELDWQRSKAGSES